MNTGAELGRGLYAIAFLWKQQLKTFNEG